MSWVLPSTSLTWSRSSAFGLEAEAFEQIAPLWSTVICTDSFSSPAPSASAKVSYDNARPTPCSSSTWAAPTKQATTLESQMIHPIQELPGEALKNVGPDALRDGGQDLRPLLWFGLLEYCSEKISGDRFGELHF